MTTDTSDAFKRNEHKIFAGMNKTPNAIQVTLPWPARALSPNSRPHIFALRRASKKAREMAWALVLEQLGGNKVDWQSVSLDWEFCPPSRRHYDSDNLVAQHKAAQDGIADALGINDSRFVSTYQLGSPVKGGAVHVTIRKAA
jgi:crossover junction endodeoxyribonuclease RusA